MLDVESILSRNNPKLSSFDYESPLSVGNGRFAFTADVTGLQTFASEYEEKGTPLCTMSEWGWNSELLDHSPHRYQLSDLEMTKYQFDGREVVYPVERTSANQEVYDWLRHNPHKFNLARISFIWQGETIDKKWITQIDQELDLYRGRLMSKFMIKDVPVYVETVVGQEEDVLSIKVESKALETKDLAIKFSFPYGSHEISGSDWDKENKHTTSLTSSGRKAVFNRHLDDLKYHVSLVSEQDIEVEEIRVHQFKLTTNQKCWQFSLKFSEEEQLPQYDFADYLAENKEMWHQFWDEGGLVDFSESTDARAHELERRVVLSLYLLAIQSTGHEPPQETGLTCNSWYGKFHLEMHLWHTGAFPLYNHSALLERSFDWYEQILPKAKENAARNGYQGARWPKMVASEGVDCPSPIAPLLIWQQTHLIYMLELVYQSTKNEEMLEKYWPLVEETALFVVDFLVYDEEDNRYHMHSPIIPAQEEYDPTSVKNPTFELEYWRFGLTLAANWAKRMGLDRSKWLDIAEKMADSTIDDGLYMAHEKALDTFKNYNQDHPSMVGSFGLIPNDRIDQQAMRKTLDKVIDVWQYKTLWGWDFAMMVTTWLLNLTTVDVYQSNLNFKKQAKLALLLSLKRWPDGLVNLFWLAILVLIMVYRVQLGFILMPSVIYFFIYKINDQAYRRTIEQINGGEI